MSVKLESQQTKEVKSIYGEWKWVQTNANESTESEKTKMPHTKAAIWFLFQPFWLSKITLQNFTLE